MCRDSSHGGRRCPYDTSPERNAKRRAAYAAKKTADGLPYRPHKREEAVQVPVPVSSGLRKGVPVFTTDTIPTPAPEGFVKLYHGTNRKHHLDSIGDDGLKASENVAFPARWYMLTTSYEQALSYGEDVAVAEFTLPVDALKRRHELECVWPGVEHNVYGITATAYAPKGAVPTEYLTGFYEATEG